MLFTVNHLEGIKSGKISLAFRKWKNQGVNAGSRINTAIGIIEITSMTECDREHITTADANQAGFSDLDRMLSLLDKFSEGTIYKMGVRYVSEDPRIKLREQTDVTDQELEELLDKLKRLDMASNQGKWTIKILKAIQENPLLRAADLAVKVKKEKEWLKLNVRKLKNLGLTVSHEPGYTLSPLGGYLLEKVGAEK
ncbi:ASCH domain-containing protein [Dyadobacter aurulentus]|uniref:ASCH domain-containing protein n=1 Tax=Dyadobacter sp. UC 10 TaxID=2605428 RepID=UPI0011F14EF2|nr:ASCH domain-containing protein [Dyadobacter sp. UC 10]KAA0991925.1 ASCH domain-containing protein [Dyadobacter sp. UC 10]